MRCDLWHRDSGHITQRFRDIANRIVGEKISITNVLWRTGTFCFGQ